MIMIRAAFALFAIATLAAIDARPAAAEIYRPWCVQYSSGSGNNGLTCAFTSFEQCMMTGGPGTGGSCVQIPGTSGTGSTDAAAATIAAGPGSGEASLWQPFKRGDDSIARYGYIPAERIKFSNASLQSREALDDDQREATWATSTL